MTYDEYLDLVVQTARQNVRAGETWATAAAVGKYLRAAAPDVTHRTFGKASMLAVLEELERAQRLKLVRTSKDALAIEPLESSKVDRVYAVEPVSRSSFNPLHAAVWNAFALSAPVGRRFMNRRNGLVRSGLESAPSPADEWVEIVPVSTATQHDWAAKFVDDNAGKYSDVAREALNDETWHPRDFVLALKSADEGLARRWNLFRSQRVSEVVQEWLDQHALAHHLAFNARNRDASVGEAAAVSGDTGCEAMRRTILAALATLPLEQLLELRIPAGAMLTAIQSTRR